MGVHAASSVNNLIERTISVKHVQFFIRKLPGTVHDHFAV
jgi:hypothetical protein